MAKPVINVQVFSDLACPWCWVGHRRLSAAIKQLGSKARVNPEWHAFLLDPSLPEGAEDIQVALERKFGRPAGPMMERLRQAGAPDGATFSGWKWRANTVPGHMVVAAARKVGKSHEANELLFQAAFEQGKSLFDEAVLSEVTQALGLGPSAEEVIGSSEGGWDQELRNEVTSDDQRAKYQLQVSGVPFFVISSGSSKKYALSGAQPTEVFQELLEQVLQEGGGSSSASQEP